jgi:hypothetical protein
MTIAKSSRLLSERFAWFVVCLSIAACILTPFGTAAAGL